MTAWKSSSKALFDDSTRVISLKRTNSKTSSSGPIFFFVAAFCCKDPVFLLQKQSKARKVKLFFEDEREDAVELFDSEIGVDCVGEL